MTKEQSEKVQAWLNSEKEKLDARYQVFLKENNISDDTEKKPAFRAFDLEEFAKQVKKFAEPPLTPAELQERMEWISECLWQLDNRFFDFRIQNDKDMEDFKNRLISFEDKLFTLASSLVGG